MRLTFFKHISAARSLSLVAQNSNKRRFIVRESNIIFFFIYFRSISVVPKKNWLFNRLLLMLQQPHTQNDKNANTHMYIFTRFQWKRRKFLQITIIKRYWKSPEKKKCNNQQQLSICGSSSLRWRYIKMHSFYETFVHIMKFMFCCEYLFFHARSFSASIFKLTTSTWNFMSSRYASHLWVTYKCVWGA